MLDFIFSVDMIVASIIGESDSLQFYLYDKESGKFNKDESLKQVILDENFKVRNAVAVDINKDDILDLVITVIDQTTKFVSNLIYLGKKSETGELITFTLDFSIEEEVFIANFTGSDISIMYFDKSKKERLVLTYTEGKKIM